ncbi:hypothetical protein ACWGN5_27555 [Streptomyces sp. NPDC055815]
MRRSRRLAVTLAAATSLLPLLFVPSASAKPPVQVRVDHVCGQPTTAARNALACITNNTDEDLELVSTELVHGVWTWYPPQTIHAHTNGTWAGHSRAESTGSQIRAKYRTASGWVGNFEVGIEWWSHNCWAGFWTDGGSPDIYTVTDQREESCASMIQTRFTIDKK